MMLLLALIVVLRTLLLVPDKKPELPEDIAVELYKTRKAEIERDVEYGTLKPEQLAATYEELDRALLQDVHSDTTTTTSIYERQKRDWWAAGAIALLLPLVAISIYINLGEPGKIDGKTSTLAMDNAEQLPSIEIMIQSLVDRLQENPEDQKGWFMLAKSYMAMGRYSEAVVAYEQLYELTGDQPGILLGYANALAMVNGGQVSGPAEVLVNKAIELEPDNSTALWLAGMAAYEKNEHKVAVDYWQHLLPKLQAEESLYQELSQLISQAQQQINAVENQPENLVAKRQYEFENATKISVDVSLSDDLLSKTKPTDTLFIFARAAEGPKMPLAVVRKHVSDLPLTVVLDDSMAMLPSMKLSDYQEVVVGARISRSGNAVPQSGDYESETINVSPGDEVPVDLHIKSQIQ